ncbi:Rv2640c family ArsR-like transcriptional regulator [Mycolicibacter minnesotensis]
MPKALPVFDMSAPVCCPAVAVGPLSDADALAIAMRLKAIADPVRIKIVSYLFSSSDGEQTSRQLAAVLDLSESTISHHLGRLRKAGIVISDRRGMNVFHQVRPDALQALCTALDPGCCT